MWRAVITLFSTLTVSTAAVAQEPLNFQFFEFPPMYVDQGNGAWGGEMVDIFDRISKKLGLKYTASAVPPVRLVQNMVEGKADVSIAGPQLFVGKDVLISEKDVTLLDLRVYAIGRDPPIASMTDLRGTTLITMLGYSYGSIRPFIANPENNVKISVEARTHEQSLLALVGGRAQYLLNYENNIQSVVKEKPVADLRSVSLSRVPLRFVVTKARPDAQSLMDRFEKALAEVKGAPNS